MRDKVDELKQVLKGKKTAEAAKPAEENLEETVSNLKVDENFEAELAKAKEQAQENQDKYLRLYAEFENFRKRSQKEKEDFSRYASERVLTELLPILDDFERALSHAESAKDIKVLVDGLKMVEKQMGGVLERFGLKSFSTLGEAFNPHRHEAMAHQASSEYPADTVMAEYRRGYTMNDKLVRPALVAVSKGPEGSDVEAQKPLKH